MTEPKKVSHIVANTTDGPKVLNSIPPVLLQAGQVTDGAVDLTAAEFASMSGTGHFKFDGASAAEPGPLDGSVEDLTTHLATLTNADEVQKLLDAETAGKSRKGAVAALEARRDELLA